MDKEERKKKEKIKHRYINEKKAYVIVITPKFFFLHP
jgi:hypothetical protein